MVLTNSKKGVTGPPLCAPTEYVQDAALGDRCASLVIFGRDVLLVILCFVFDGDARKLGVQLAAVLLHLLLQRRNSARVAAFHLLFGWSFAIPTGPGSQSLGFHPHP